MDEHEDCPRMNRDDALANALRALPMATPSVDLWPQLARDLKPARARPLRRALPLALAASVLIGLLVTHSTWRDTDDGERVASIGATVGPVAASELQALRERSQDLEGWVAALAAQAPRDGRSLMAAAEVEDLVGLVDVQLSAVRNEQEALPLWRQRVALLEDLAVMRSAPTELADAGGGTGVAF